MASCTLIKYKLLYVCQPINSSGRELRVIIENTELLQSSRMLRKSLLIIRQSSRVPVTAVDC
jgi:hypothetical protein